MTQKVIKIGSSAGVTIPKRQLTELGLGVGDEVKITIEAVNQSSQPHSKLMTEYQDFVKHYGQTLKNLAKR